MMGLVLFTLVISVVCCGLYRGFARRWQIYDIPNERSAHELPIPRGGGVGVYFGLLAGCVLATFVLGNWSREFWILLSLAAMPVALGILDDVRGLSVWLRFLAYGVICFAGVHWLMPDLTPPLLVLGSVYALWMLNLYNFMDGIDAIAATETLFVCVAAAGLSFWWAGPSQFALFCLLLAAASGGFLYWNWPPAQLFMGDAGSVTLGFLLALLSLLGAYNQALPLGCWLILLAVFICDASATLLWRMATGQAFTQAHSLHLYQRLSRHWGTHVRVVWAVLAVNVLWLAPLALAAMLWQPLQWYLVALAYIPMILLMLKTHKLP